ncbi:MAG TPA: radical SAM protein [Tissierellales bacterium]|nr:radical SAM protein [Tissierellales bacterium]
MSNKHYIIPIFVPHLGCPHSCVFCNQQRITGLSTNVNINDVKKKIENSLETIPKNKKKLEVAFYGGSFTGIDKEVQKDLLTIPYNYKKEDIIDEIRLSTRPDYINTEILKLLKSFGVDTIELGVQSLANDVLKASGRGHVEAEVYKAVDLIKKFDFKLGLQMMVGLPKDTKEKSLYTAKQIASQRPDCVRIYPTLIIKDTYLEKLYLNGNYIPLSLEEAVNISTDLLLLFEYYNINVIRIGLQPTEKISLGKDVVAGPFHPSFRQLVESNIYKMILERYFETMDKFRTTGKTLILKINNKDISNISGQKSKNIKYIKEKYGFKKIKIYGEDVADNNIKINFDNIYDTINKDEIIKDYLFKNNIIT